MERWQDYLPRRSTGQPSSCGNAINNLDQAVGISYFGFYSYGYATEWSGGKVINLNPTGSTSSDATGINDLGQVVGSSVFQGISYATEWSRGNPVYLKNLPGSVGSEAALSGSVLKGRSTRRPTTFLPAAVIATLPRSAPTAV